MMFSLQFGYICTLVSVSIVFAWLSFQGPPRPTTHESNLPAQTFISVMELGNSTFAAWTDEANRLWDSEAVLPSNGGAVLATNLSSGFHFWAKPAMFHHLMCLREVRRQFVKMSASWDADFLSGRARSGSEYENLGYCFDYLRQGLLCHADTTLNPVATVDENSTIIDGNVLWHTCKESHVLYRWSDISGTPRHDPLIHEQQ